MFKGASKLTLLDSDMKEKENDDSSFESSDETKEQSGQEYEKDALEKINDYVINLRKKRGQESLTDDRKQILIKHKERKHEKFLKQMSKFGFHTQNKGCILHQKTAVCKHDHGCLSNVIMSYKSTFKWSLIIKLALFYLVRLAKIFKIRSFA